MTDMTLTAEPRIVASDEHPLYTCTLAISRDDQRARLEGRQCDAFVCCGIAYPKGRSDRRLLYRLLTEAIYGELETCQPGGCFNIPVGLHTLRCYATAAGLAGGARPHGSPQIGCTAL